ncbi:dUTP diphosphatase [Entomobacter blattae]|uniref:dUTP diphosphatase n=1 Tax=Entomobacter blattae TaxID=2762277 RepID=A0A7H1NTU2_9PROT|nr:dUTP diphosphatase [Entomobacter blattae]QNT79202.1 Deoxyuridine 5'-triphosphate nucleotidohydrolase [Entomobacter blattae]
MKLTQEHAGGYSMKLKIQTLPHYDLRTWGLPSYGSDGAAGFDLRAAFDIKKQYLHVSDPDLMSVLYGNDKRQSKALLKDAYLNIFADCTTVFGSGICIEVPTGYELQIRSRSGKGINDGLIITHGVGTIDSDYRGEIMIAIRNISNKTRNIFYGEKIAQAILAPIYRAEWEQTTTLTETQRGQNGFGSTGI